MNLYTWSRRQFTSRAHPGSQDLDADPLSPEGALVLYCKARNKRALEAAERLAQKCALVLGVPPDDEDDDDDFFDIASLKGERAGH
jgi:hypothetical protein